MASAMHCASCGGGGGVKATLLKHQSCVFQEKEELLGLTESGHQLADCTAGNPASPSMPVPASLVSDRVWAEQDFETLTLHWLSGLLTG